MPNSQCPLNLYPNFLFSAGTKGDVQWGSDFGQEEKCDSAYFFRKEKKSVFSEVPVFQFPIKL